MTPAEGLRWLQLIRYAPRQPTIAWLANATGYSPTALYDSAKRGWMNQAMVDRLEPALRRLRVLEGHIVFFSKPGDYAYEPRGAARPGQSRWRERAPRAPAGRRSSSKPKT